jgi:YHS domain-containing protein
MKRMLMAALVLALCAVAAGIVLLPAAGPRGTGIRAAASGPDHAMAGVCQKSCATRQAFDEADVVPQPGAVVGRLTRCPVSGVVFTVHEDGTAVSYAGSTWYLCCDGCAKKFRQDPARFTGA